MRKGLYTMNDLKKIIHNRFGFFKVGKYYRKNDGVEVKFVGIRNRILVYNPHTFEPRFMFGTFYEFKTDNDIIFFEDENVNYEEWKMA